jgi:hypothetical protein
MATQHQSDIARLTAGAGGRSVLSAHVTLTMVAGAAVTDSTFVPPAGCRLEKISWHTSVNFTGAPTNINLTIGKAAAGTDYVAAVDIKTAAAPTTAVFVAAADYDSWTSGQALFATLTAVGGTNPAGSVMLVCTFAPITATA